MVLLLVMPLTLPLAACSGGSETDAMKAANTYISEISRFIKVGGDYAELGMQIQAGRLKNKKG